MNKLDCDWTEAPKGTTHKLNNLWYRLDGGVLYVHWAGFWEKSSHLGVDSKFIEKT